MFAIHVLLNKRQKKLPGAEKVWNLFKSEFLQIHLEV